MQPAQPLDLARKRLQMMLAQAGCATVPTLGFGAVFLAFGISSAAGGRSSPANFLPFLIPFVLVAGVMLLIGVYTLWRAIRTARALGELGNADIQSTNGTVQWSGRRYTIDATPKLELLQGQELMPGPYQLRYLPQSRFVIESVPLAATGTEQRAQVTGALGSVFSFDEADLAGCRGGQLTTAHQNKLRRNAGRDNIFIGIIMAVFALIGVATFIQPLLNGRFTAAQLFPALIFIGVPAFMFFAMRGGRRAIDKGAVAMIEGPVTERRSSSGKTTNYYFNVGNMSFRVPHAAHTALVAGQRYRVYYLPESKQLVGIEPV